MRNLLKIPPHLLLVIILACSLLLNPIVSNAGVVDNTGASTVTTLLGQPKASTNDTVFSLLYSVLNKLNSLATSSQITTLSQKMDAQAAQSGVVKSVQRGTASGNQTITINAVNPAKSVVLLNGAVTVMQTSAYYTCRRCGYYFGGANYAQCPGCGWSNSDGMGTITRGTVSNTPQPYVSAMSSTSFTVANSIGGYSWQVIEYY